MSWKCVVYVMILKRKFDGMRRCSGIFIDGNERGIGVLLLNEWFLRWKKWVVKLDVCGLSI